VEPAAIFWDAFAPDLQCLFEAFLSSFMRYDVPLAHFPGLCATFFAPRLSIVMLKPHALLLFAISRALLQCEPRPRRRSHSLPEDCPSRRVIRAVMLRDFR